MAAEVSADLNHIQDEDVLRRMWADTDDFSKKKEIRARMYKLREQRLKEFYTTGEVVTEIKGSKRATTTHTESIGDQGFLTMKAKEIRDSESPTRDISRRGNGYWNTVQERGYTTTNREDGAVVEVTEESKRGDGLVVEGNTETRIATAQKSSHEKAEKSDENMTMKSQKISQNKAFASDAVTVLDDGVCRTQSEENQSSSKSTKEEKTAHSTSQTSSYSTSTSSKKQVVSSTSKSQTYLITSDGQRKLISDTEVKALTGGDDNRDYQSTLRSSDVKSTVSGSKIQEKTVQQSTDNKSQVIDSADVKYFDDSNVENMRSTQDSSTKSTNVQNQSTSQTSKTSQSSTKTSYVVSSNQNEIQNIENQRQTSNLITSKKHDTSFKDTKISSEENQNENQTTRVIDYRDNTDRESRKGKESNEFITNEKIDITKTVNETENQRAPSRQDIIRSTTDSTQQRTTEQSEKILHNESRTTTDQNILTEINKLDNYLQGQQTPSRPSEPATPKDVTDGAKWTVVTDKGGEFVYRDDRTPMEGRRVEPYEYQPREAPIKPPSSLDLPTDATDGQYLTTYGQAYNRISVDNSPSHQYFMTTLRASPLSHDRLTPTSPTKSSRSSLDRSSPERRVRPSSRGSLDRSSPDSIKKRSYSKGSLDRSSPDRPQRFSPTKSVTSERRGSSSSYTIEKRKDTRRKTTEITQSTLKDTTKPKRKFSSTQQKAANKARTSTPGASPSPSPTRGSRPKDTSSGSESDISHATYNKQTSISSVHDENITTQGKVDISKTNIDVKTTKKEHPIFDITRGRDMSPEYSSEGSVSRELKKSKISSQITTTETSAFRPIKPTKGTAPTEETDKQFITEEQKYTVKETDENEKTDLSNRKGDQTCTITEITDESDDISKSLDRNVKDAYPGPRDETITTVTKETSVTERSTTDKKQSTSSIIPERGTTTKVTKKPSSTETPRGTSPTKRQFGGSPDRYSPTKRQPGGSPDKYSPTKRQPVGSPDRYSPSKRQPDGSPDRYSPTKRQPVGSPDRYSPTKRQPSGSSDRSSPTRASPKKTLSDDTSYQPRNKSQSPDKKRRSPTKTTPSSSPTSSPERRSTKTQITERRTSRRDDRSSISSSPSPTRRRPLVDTQNIQTVTSKQFIREERRDSKKSTQSPSVSPVRKEATRKSPSKHSGPTDRFTSPQKKPTQTSPLKSPQTIKSSPKPKSKLPEPKRTATPIKVQPRYGATVTITTTTTKKAIQRSSTEPKQTPRATSAPSTTKPFSPRSSKDKIENTTVKRATTDVKRTTSLPREKVTSVIKTVTRLSSTTPVERKPSPQAKPGASRRPLDRTGPTSPRSRDAPKQTTTKTTDTINKTETQRTTNIRTKTSQTVREAVNQPIKSKPTQIIEEIDIQVTPKSSEIRINEQFITEERIDLDIEDEHPPNEFYDDVTDSSPERKPKPDSAQPSVKSVPQMPKTSKLAPTGIPSVSMVKQTDTKTVKSSTKKTTKRRKSLKDGQVPSSSSSSSSEEEDNVQIDKTDSVTKAKRVERDTAHTSNQDLLTVIVQHPKSSRESSPGKTSTGIPFCTTSEDGESNPRYADFVSEPEDVEIFDKNVGPGAPVRLTDEPDAPVPSVADRMNTFLENTRNTQETIIKKEITSEAPKSVLKKKTLFESIAKNQSVDIQRNTSEEVYHTEEINIDEKLTKQKSLDVPSGPTTNKVSPSSKPSGTVLGAKFKTPDYVDEITTEVNSIVTSVTDVTDLSESRKLIESEINTSEVVQETTEDYEIAKTSQVKSTKPSHEEPKPSYKQLSPQKQTTKSPDQPTGKKPFERKSSGTVVDVSTKKNFFERKVQDIKESLFKSPKKKETTPKTKQAPVSTRPDSGNEDEHSTVESRADSYMRATVSSTVKTQSPERIYPAEDYPDHKTPRENFTRKTSEPDKVRKQSKPEDEVRRPEEPGRKSSKPERSPERKTSKPSEITRTPSKPAESTRRISSSSPERKSSKPSEITRTPSKPEEVIRKPSGTDRASPERKTSKPSEIKRTPSKPDEMVRRPSGQSPERRPSKQHEITRKPSPTAPLEIKKISKSEEVAKKVSKFETVTKKSSQSEITRHDSFTKSTTTRSQSPDKDYPDHRGHSYMKSTLASSQRAQTPVQHPDSPEPEDVSVDQGSPEPTDHTDFGITKVQSYMRSTESSTLRESMKSPDEKRKPSTSDIVTETSKTKKTSTTSKTDVEMSEKFGVTLRKTPSATKVVTSKTTITRQHSKPGENVDIESIFDLEILEAMLLKAVAYEERRRIRAQIRVVKKAIEEERNAAVLGSRITTTTSKDIKRQSSLEQRKSSQSSPADRKPTSPERKPTPYPESRYFPATDRNRTVEQRLFLASERKSSSPERKPKSFSPERKPAATSPERRPSDRRTSPERSPTRRTDKPTTNGYKDNKVFYESTSTVRSQSVKKSSVSDAKEPSPTDLITSSYGVGPTDENGKPLFGLRALRRTSTTKTLLDESEEFEKVVEEEEERSSRLFGLRALQPTEGGELGGEDTMPAESSQLRELVQRHQQYVKESSTKEVQLREKPKAKLRDSFILSQEEEDSLSRHQEQQGRSPSDGGLTSLSSIIQKTDNSGTRVRSSMESRSTVVKSHTSVSSDGKVSLHRDVIQGEVSSKNGSEPTGKVTRSSYSFQKDGRDSTPNIKSSTATALISGGRRLSGPKIEEITDQSSAAATDATRRFSKEYTVEDGETVSERRRSSGQSVEENVKKYTSILKNSSAHQQQEEAIRRGSGPRITELPDDDELTFYKKVSTTKSSQDAPDSKATFSSTTSRSEETKSESSKKVVTRGDSVKALQHKFQQATEGVNPPPPQKGYPKAGLILRSNSLQQSDDSTQLSSSRKQSSVERTDSKGTLRQDTKESVREESRGSPVSGGRAKVSSSERSSMTVTTSSSSSSKVEPSSFLDNRTKVTGVQDILTRMRNADLVSEATDSTEDAEARALLNKFLGASVILQGMEQGMRASSSTTSSQQQQQTTTTTSSSSQRQSNLSETAAIRRHSAGSDDSVTAPASASLVNQAEKLRMKASSVRTVEEEIDDITDEKQLRILLDACSDYEGRRKLRARLRTIMAEQKGGTDEGDESHGELLGLRNVDDSGIESGEDLRGVNPEVMKEVEEALGRLEGVIGGLDPSRRVAVVQLMSSLQNCLKLPLKRRLTVGVSSEELAAARKWYEPALEEMPLEHVAFRPVAQRAGFTMEPVPQVAVLSYIAEVERTPSGDSGSLQDYDPSLILFTPEQSVQIAIHKAAINKQISQEEKRRESSEDGDISSDENSEVKFDQVSSAQRLLQLATESAKKNPSAGRFHNRSSRKQKIKRANTIDIPKPANFCEYSSGDEYGASADEVNNPFERRRSSRDTSFLPPSFVPKTENDLKFLAFLKQVNDNQPKVQTYNPSAGGGKHWRNRFSSIKTAFENPDSKPTSAAPSPAKMFWQNSEAGKSKSNNKSPKLPWTVKTDNDGAIVGSLTVTKPGHVNKFNHAPKSAFKPIEKKPASAASGTVKQIAAQKFSVFENDTRIEKPIIKPKPLPGSFPNTPSSPKKNGSHSSFQPFPQPSSNFSGNKFPENQGLSKSYSSQYDSAKPFTSSPKTYSKISNGSHYPQSTSSSSTQNKIKFLEATSQNYKTNNATSKPSNKDSLTNSQLSTLTAKKQFLDSTLTSPKIDKRPSDFYASSDVNHNKIITNGSNKYLNQNISQTSFSPNYSGYQSNFVGSAQNNSSSNFIQPPQVIQKPSVDYYPHKESDKNSTHFENSKHFGSYIKADIVEPIIIPKEVNTQKNTYNYTNSVQAYPKQQSFTEPELVSYKAIDPGRMPSQYPMEPIPPIRHDSLSINFQYPDKFPKVISETNPLYKPPGSPGAYKENFKFPEESDGKPYTTYITCSNNTLRSSTSPNPCVNDNNFSNQSNYLVPTIVPTPPLAKEEPLSPLSNVLTPNSDRLSPLKYYNNVNKSVVGDSRYLSASYQSPSPHRTEETSSTPWGSVARGSDQLPQEEKAAVSRVMGQAQCQQAVTVNSRTKRRFDLDLESELKLQLKQSAVKKSLSPSFPNVLQKSESWHQMVKEQMQQAKQAPPLPKITKAKSSHTLAAQPKQFEAALPPDSLAQKKITVSQYLSKQQNRSVKSTKSNPKFKSTNTLNVQQDDDDIDMDNVDEVFENIFQETTKKRNSK